MNVFALSVRPHLAARWAVDAHTNKMVTESIQILSTVHWLWMFKHRGNSVASRVAAIRSDKGLLCKPFTSWGLRRPVPEERRDDIELSVHGCITWAAESLDNYKWLVELAFRLHEEWKYRQGHPTHKIQAGFPKLIWCSRNFPDMPDVGMTPFYQAMPDHFRGPCPVTAYRRLYRAPADEGGKRHLHEWTNREPPHWL